MLGSISHLLQSSRKCIQTQIRHIKSECENVSVFLLCAFLDALIFLPLAVVKFATPPSVSATPSPLGITANLA